ncbi:hypothetical protein PTNB29_06542 [Pyrenophora teres f. teres]|nr:hypothetical protein PTNB29_06542 [Pyrenophora teres f. teres]
MRFTVLALAAAASYASAQGVGIPLGYECNPKSTPCAHGASCFTADLSIFPITVASTVLPICGDTNAPCTSDEQCAYNACVQGVCSGFRAGALPSPTATSSKFRGALPAPSPTIVAAPGSLPLGAKCNPNVKPEQCANASCWGSNMMSIATCGGFNAECTTDDNCHSVKCRNGLCSSSPKPKTSIPATANATMTTMPAQSASPGPVVNGTMPIVNGTIPIANGTTVSNSGTPTATRTPEFTGAASAGYTAGGLLALVVGAAAIAL